MTRCIYPRDYEKSQLTDLIHVGQELDTGYRKQAELVGVVFTLPIEKYPFIEGTGATTRKLMDKLWAKTSPRIKARFYQYQLSDIFTAAGIALLSFADAVDDPELEELSDELLKLREKINPHKYSTEVT